LDVHGMGDHRIVDKFPNLQRIKGDVLIISDCLHLEYTPVESPDHTLHPKIYRSGRVDIHRIPQLVLRRSDQGFGQGQRLFFSSFDADFENIESRALRHHRVTSHHSAHATSHHTAPHPATHATSHHAASHTAPHHAASHHATH